MRKLRKELELTQEQLAERASLHWTYIGGIERGVRNPSLKNINAIARALFETFSIFSGWLTPLES